MIIAHRGASYTAPENTIAAIDTAWRAGSDAVEVDIRLTADRRIVLMHDPSTRRTTGRDYRVAETDSECIRALDAGSWKSARFRGERVPYLEEVTAAVPIGKRLFIEIKSDEAVFGALMPLIIPETCTVIGFDIDIMAQCKTLMPDIAVYWLCDPLRMPRFGSRRTAAVDSLLETVVRRNLDGIDIQHRHIDGDLCRAAENAGIDVFAWTVDNPRVAARLLDMGVSGITTNHPELLKAHGL